MIDTLMRQLPLASLDRLRGRVDVTKGQYAVLTLHRPSNVDRSAKHLGRSSKPCA